MSWAHTRVLSVTVGDELTLYPVPVRLTEAVFKSLANGGQCLTAHDLAFYSLAGALLPFDKRVHDLTTGEISYWVGVDPADATFVMTWGDATVTAALEDASGVWDDEYEAVWHLDENAATTDYLDATSHGHVSVTAPVNSEDRFVADPTARAAHRVLPRGDFHARRCGRTGSTHRLREPGEPAPRPWRNARARDRSSLRAWRES